MRAAFVFLFVLAGCAAPPPKINEANWLYELERNGFEQRWQMFLNALSEAEAAKLGEVFETETDEALVAFEASLGDLERSKFRHHLESARYVEESRREMIAKSAAGGSRASESLFDKIEIVPGAPKTLPVEEPTAGLEHECLEPETAYEKALAEGRVRKAANPLPPTRKDVEVVTHRLHPFGFARFWERRARKECVTTAAITGR